MNQFTAEETLAIKRIFEQFDRDKDGFINKRELDTLATALNDPLTPAELANFFKGLDKNNSGKITWNEFIAYWGNN